MLYNYSTSNQIKSEYGKRNPSKGNSHVDIEEDDELDSADMEFYNDPFQNPDYQEDLTLVNVVKCCKCLHICLPAMLGFQLASQALNMRVYPLSKVLGTWIKAYAMFSNNRIEYRCTNVTPLSMLSHAKSMASRDIYHHILYRRLVCSYIFR